jgi:hypothetical protein
VDGNGFVRFFETSSSAVDLGYDLLGRSGLVKPTLSTMVTLDLTGLVPWTPSGDEVQLTSSNADVWDPAILGADVAASATTALHAEDWAASSVGRLNLLAASDVLYVHQLATSSVAIGLSSYPYQAVSAAAFVGGVTLTDGVGQTIPATLTAPGANGSVALSWQLSQFEALLPAMGPSATAGAGAHTLIVGANAHPLTNPAPMTLVGAPELFRIALPAGIGDASAESLGYGQFLPPP